jgi:hypothetical protein
MGRGSATGGWLAPKRSEQLLHSWRRFWGEARRGMVPQRCKLD